MGECHPLFTLLIFPSKLAKGILVYGLSVCFLRYSFFLDFIWRHLDKAINDARQDTKRIFDLALSVIASEREPDGALRRRVGDVHGA